MKKTDIKKMEKTIEVSTMQIGRIKERQQKIDQLVEMLDSKYIRTDIKRCSKVLSQFIGQSEKFNTTIRTYIANDTDSNKMKVDKAFIKLEIVTKECNEILDKHTITLTELLKAA